MDRTRKPLQAKAEEVGVSAETGAPTKATQRKERCNKQKRIYLKNRREWVEVGESFYYDYMLKCDAHRKRMQSHGRCICPRRRFWLCDTDCLACEFRRAGDVLSLDQGLDETGSDLSLLDTLEDTAPSIEDIVADFDELSGLLHELAQIMPEAIKVGILREQGLTESAIAAELGIPRTTLRSRLAKAREQLAQEYPDIL